MKARVTLFIGLILCMCLASCDERVGYKELDGMWQLRTIETLSNQQVAQIDDIYYSFQLNVVNIRKIGFWDGYGSFTYKGDSIHIVIKEMPEKHLHQFGLDSNEEHFEVEKVNSSKLVLKSDYARLEFRKY